MCSDNNNDARLWSLIATMSAAAASSSSLLGRSASSSSSIGADGGSGAIDPVLEERLSSLLASPDFSVAGYLNLALALPDEDGGADRSPEERERLLEQRMASLALQLQMRTQSCHDEIGRIGAELQAIVPRCAADVGRLRVGLEGMELDVRGLLEGMDAGGGGKKKSASPASGADASAGGAAAEASSAAAAASRGDDPLATLHSLLNLRTHLTASRAILQAASSWDETINSIPMLLSTTPPNLVEAVAALSQLERGARALRGMPEGRDERDAALRKLRTQLEVLLKPQLLHALKRMDTRLGPLQKCVTMYSSLGKMDVMREEYVRMRPAEMHALWFSFGRGGDDEVDAGDAEEEKDREGEDDDEEEAEDFDFDDDDAGADSKKSAPPPITAAQRRERERQTARQFAEFLPSFYESVLELLARERTQSKLVFGPEMAPSIVAQVLAECFRPLVGSFERRLGGLCPPPGADKKGSLGGGAGEAAGGTEAIAAMYESTVQFLSLAYDQIEAWNAPPSAKEESKEGGAAAAPSAENDVAGAVRSAFLSIASPFAPYQRDLAAAERDPLGEAAAAVAKDVRGVVNFEHDAAFRLGDLAPFMFPLAEGESCCVLRVNAPLIMTLHTLTDRHQIAQYSRHQSLRAAQQWVQRSVDPVLH